MWALMSEVKKVCTKKGNFNAPVLYLVYKESYYDRRLPQPLFCLYILAKQRTIKIEHIDRVTVCLEIKRWFELKKVKSILRKIGLSGHFLNPYQIRMRS